MIKMNVAVLILVTLTALFIGALAGAYFVAVYAIKQLEKLETEHQNEMEKAQVDSYYEGFDDGKKHLEYNTPEWKMPASSEKAIQRYRVEHGLPPLGKK